MTSTESGTLIVEREGPVTVLTMNRPERRNALNVELVVSLAAAVENAAHDGTRALVLCANGAVFCAGGDLAEIAGIASGGAHAATDMIYGNFHRLVHALRRSPVPLVAAVTGPALGAGLDLALWCDLRVAAPTATLASTWIKLGLVTGMGGSALLTRLVGAARATELVLTGRSLSADEALSWGLITRVSNDPRTEALELARALSDLDPRAVALNRAALHRSADVPIEHELTLLASTQGSLLARPEFAELAAKTLKA